MAWLIPLGLLAGLLTTLAGLGGGLLMTLAMAAVWDPARALATAAPALLLGNLHRVAMYRRHIHPSAFRFVLGAAPGALFGAVLTVSLPDVVLRFILVAAALLAIARQLGLFSWRPGPRTIAPVSFGAGVMTATSGGGGLLLGPLMLATGLEGERFVVTGSLVACSMHIARLAGYGAGGLLSEETLTASLVLAASILLGNTLGKRLRVLFNERRGQYLTYAVLVVCVTLSVAGLR